MPFAKIEDAVAAIGRGEIVVVVDDEDRENEGDLIMAAEYATPEKPSPSSSTTPRATSARRSPRERARELELDLMVRENTESMRTAFTGQRRRPPGHHAPASRPTTGPPRSRPWSIRPPVPPTSPVPATSTRSSPARVACSSGPATPRPPSTSPAWPACYPAGVLCEIVDEKKMDMARVPELERFAEKHGLLFISIADMIRYRRKTEKLVKRVAEARIPTEWGDFTCYAYESTLDGIEHLAFVRGNVAGEDDVLVRVHTECLTGDVFGSLRCDCGPQLAGRDGQVAEADSGVVVYLRGHEGRGIGIGHKLRAYSLQEEGQDTVDANLALGLPVDSREYGIGAQILVDLGVTSMRVMTNNPAKYGGLDGFGIKITGRVPLESVPNPENIKYLRTKRERMGHLLEGLDDVL